MRNRINEIKFKDVLAGLLIGLGVGLGWYFGFGPGQGSLERWSGRSETTPILAPEVNQPAPNFSLSELNGEEINLQEFSGKPVLINFWATWCIPCREEMPLIEKYYKDYYPNLVVLGVNVGEKPEIVRAFVDELGLTFPILMDQGNKISSLYKVLGFPTTIFIDEDGVLMYQYTGLLTEDQLRNYMEQLGIPLS